MSKELLNQMGNVIFVLGHVGEDISAEVITEAVQRIKDLEVEVKDLKDEKDLLKDKLIRKKVRKYNNQQYEGEE